MSEETKKPLIHPGVFNWEHMDPSMWPADLEPQVSEARHVYLHYALRQSETLETLDDIITERQANCPCDNVKPGERCPYCNKLKPTTAKFYPKPDAGSSILCPSCARPAKYQAVGDNHTCAECGWQSDICGKCKDVRMYYDFTEGLFICPKCPRDQWCPTCGHAWMTHINTEIDECPRCGLRTPPLKHRQITCPVHPVTVKQPASTCAMCEGSTDCEHLRRAEHEARESAEVAQAITPEVLPLCPHCNGPTVRDDDKKIVCRRCDSAGKAIVICPECECKMVNTNTQYSCPKCHRVVPK